MNVTTLEQLRTRAEAALLTESDRAYGVDDEFAPRRSLAAQSSRRGRRCGLDLGAALDGWLLDPTIAYVSADRTAPTPFAVPAGDRPRGAAAPMTSR